MNPFVPNITGEDLKIIEESFRVDVREDDVVSALIKNIGRAGLNAIGCAEKEEQDTGLFKEEPVDTRTFFKDFVGEENYPLQQAAVDAVFGRNPKKWDKTYTEFVLLWGMGGGKDHLSGKILTYAAYWIKCLKEAQKYFRLGKGTSIDIANMCINARLAKNVFFEDFKNTIRHAMIPGTNRNWFEAHGVDIREGKDIRGNEIDFGDGLVAHSLNSETQSDIGMNPLLVVFDEIGGFDVKQAEELYKNTRRTQVSRFGNTKSHKRLLLSFKRSDSDYMMIRYKESENEPHIYRTKAATWEVNKAVTKEDFVEEYATDPEGAKRVYECEGDIQEAGYFRHRGSITQCINKKMTNPMKGNIHRIYNLGLTAFIDEFKPNRDSKYYCHIDLGTGAQGNDCAGFAMVHTEKMSVRFDQEYITELLKNEVDIRRLVGKELHGIVADLAFQLKARPGSEVQFSSIIEFIVDLKRKFHFNIVLVTYDGFQSIGERQRLKERGIESDLLSVDRDTIGYDTLKSLIYSGLFKHYNNPIVKRELEELIYIPDAQGRYTKRKIGHPDISIRRRYEEGDRRGSKDVADGLAGATRSCVENNKELFSFGFLTMDTDNKTIPHPKDVEDKRMEDMKVDEITRHYHEELAKVVSQKGPAKEHWETLVDSY